MYFRWQDVPRDRASWPSKRCTSGRETHTPCLAEIADGPWRLFLASLQCFNLFLNPRYRHCMVSACRDPANRLFRYTRRMHHRALQRIDTLPEPEFLVGQFVESAVKIGGILSRKHHIKILAVLPVAFVAQRFADGLV